MGHDTNDTADSTGAESTPLPSVTPALIKKGTFVDNQFTVLEQVGIGGMGVVYRAMDGKLERVVALKFLRPDKAASDLLVGEAKSMAQLSHPNVVKVYTVGNYLDQVFIAMDLIKGTSLKKWLDEPRPWRDVLQVYLQAGEGLLHAHEKGKIHRDFKADNVLLDETRRPHVTDFGLAVDASSATASTNGGPRRAAGTPGHMSPEQVLGKPLSACSDQFSFCVSLYWALTGELPFGKQMKQPLGTPIFPAGAKVPPWVRRVLLRGMREDPAERFPSMQELLAALRDDPAVRHRSWALAGLGAAVVAFVAGGAWWLTHRETEEQREVRACRDAARATAEKIFGPERAKRIDEAFVAANPAHGADDFERVRVRLEPETASWRVAASQACGLPDPLARKQLQSCLEESRRNLQAMSSLFAVADARIEASALTTVLAELLPSSTCLGKSTSRSGPSDQSGGDDPLEEPLEQARLLLVAGKYEEATEKAIEVSNEAEDRQDIEVKAEAQLLLGEIFTERHHPNGNDYLRRAIVYATNQGNDLLKVRALLMLSAWDTNLGQRFWLDANYQLQLAEATLEHLGNNPLLHAQAVTQRGRLARAKNNVDDARREFREALQLLQQLLPEEHPLVASAKNNLALVLEPDDALPMLDGVLRSRQELYGAEHPEVAGALHNLGLKRAEKGDCEGAMRAFDAALKLRETTRSYDPASLGRSHAAKSAALEFACAKLQTALEERRQALSLLEEGRATDDELVHEWLALKSLLCKLKRPPAELLEAHRKIIELSGSEETDRTPDDCR